METEIKQKLEEQDKKLEQIYESVEKTRKYFQFTFWATIIAVALPLVALAVVIPKILSLYLGSFNGLL